MSRPRYPSDEKRRTSRPHVKIHLTAKTHRRTVGIFADPAQRGMLMGLWLHAVQSFAPNTGGVVHLSRADVAWISGRTHPKHSLNSLRTICELMEYPLRVEGRTVVVTIRNLQRKQGFNSPLRDGVGRTPLPSEAEAEAEAEVKSRKPPKREPRPRIEISDEARDLTKRLAEAVSKAHPHATVPGNLTAWERQMDAMMRIDNRSANEVARLCVWLFSKNLGSEYAYVIQSPKSLREKFAKAWAQMEKPDGQSRNGKVDPLIQAGRNYLERHRTKEGDDSSDPAHGELSPGRRR